MRLDEACEPTFARHETFHPRLGWFRKAFLAAGKDHGGFFLADDAPVRLGVGKNMVRSIRFWGTATRLITDVDHPHNSRLTYTMPTNFGVGLLGPKGLDINMEHPATWWWIHWMLLAPRSAMPVWWILLNEMNVVEFDDELAQRVCIDILDASTLDRPHESSIHKDIGAFVRTYTDVPSSRGRFDDQFGCPLRDLRLVSATTAGGYRLALGPPRNLAGEVVLAAILDHLAMTGITASTASLSRLATEPGSPARAFRLNEDQLADLLAPLASRSKVLTLSAPAGAVQLGWREDPAQLAHQILCDFYGGVADRPNVAGPAAREANLDREVELLLTEQARAVVL